ncbi:C-type single domain activation associated secreted protein ASP3 [Trichostrongylus colubriformis]|uniref:C-type single domain activation associated secreted protein ASP3 n=1 Tax=Trichostrongylus colubriformis TaxID=6319 RepID=A0AAN8FZU0_TRICO
MFVFATVAYLAVLTTSEQPSTCSRSNGMTEELRKVVVDEHNKYRSLVAKGLAPNPVAGGNAPKAARMFKMYYDCSVEDKMVAWVQQCTWGHSPKTDRKGLGENLWMASPYGGNKTASIIRAVTDWFAELKEKGVPNTNQFTSAVFSRGVGHYTQVVWEKSDRIGCAIRDCPSAQMTYVGCEYKPGGNMLNDYIYEIGDPCTRNEHCKCDNCTYLAQLHHRYDRIGDMYLTCEQDRVDAYPGLVSFHFKSSQQITVGKRTPDLHDCHDFL